MGYVYGDIGDPTSKDNITGQALNKLLELQRTPKYKAANSSVAYEQLLLCNVCNHKIFCQEVLGVARAPSAPLLLVNWDTHTCPGEQEQGQDQE